MSHVGFNSLALPCEVAHALTLAPQAFFDKDYISSHPEDTERITHLKDLMQEQVRMESSSAPVCVAAGSNRLLMVLYFSLFSL